MGGFIRRAQTARHLQRMFNAFATLAQLNLLFAFLLRPFQPRNWHALARMERKLADALRATLIDAGIPVPALSDIELIAWFNANRPCSDKAADSHPLPKRSWGRGQGEGAFQKAEPAFAPIFPAPSPTNLTPSPCSRLRASTREKAHVLRLKEKPRRTTDIAKPSPRRAIASVGAGIGLGSLLRSEAGCGVGH